jgi:hypothetical protein
MCSRAKRKRLIREEQKKKGYVKPPKKQLGSAKDLYKKKGEK